MAASLLASMLGRISLQRGSMTLPAPRLTLTAFIALLAVLFPPSALHAQGLGGAGTVQGIVKDPTGGVMQAVEVKIENRVAGFSRTTNTDAMGHYVFSNLSQNSYHLSVAAQGFQTFERDVDVRTGVPITLDMNLALAGATTSVEVVG